MRSDVFQLKNDIQLLREKRIAIFILTICLFSRVFSYDPVSVVQSPLLGRPCFALPGGQFVIECKAGSEASGWTATLSMPYKEFSLPVTAGEYANGIRKLIATVPADAPSELYDIRVRASGGVDDIVQACVKIIPAYKNDFTFLHLPDCHLPSVSWIGFYDDANTVPEFRQIIKEIDIIQPEFVLQTGDIVDNGQDESQYKLAQELLAEARAPVFLTGGNHDLWYDGHANWFRAFGTAMNFSFLYGPLRFTGLEMYDIPSKTFTADQMRWLAAVLDASIQSGEKGRILFTHYDASRQITGDFVDQYKLDGLFYGHTHLNGDEKIGLRQAPKINTSYTMNGNGEYRLVKIRNGKIAETSMLKFKRLRLDLSPVNDGTASAMTAKIVNDNDADLPGVLVKLHVKRDQGPFTVTGGRALQSIDYEPNRRVYYVAADVPARGSVEVSVKGSAAVADVPRILFTSPRFDTTLAGGRSMRLEIQAAGSSLQYTWRQDGNLIAGQNGAAFIFRPEASFEGRVVLQAEASNANGRDARSWTVYVEKTPDKPKPISGTRAFFPWDQEAVISWIEPMAGSGIMEYGPVPGQPAGSIPEEGGLNLVRFTPSKIGMNTGVHYCRIRSGGLASDEFPIVIESPKAPAMTGPIGDQPTLTPVFEWEPVQGVPYYLVIMTDREIVITENKATGEYSLEGANPVWAVLTPRSGVPYGASDPSGTFTSAPAPLVPGGRYWWVVLNCYGDKAELASTVQSGVGSFRVALPQNGLVPPVPLSPGDHASLSGPSITFKWNGVVDAAAYTFYLFKVEIEEGVEVVRPVWETAASTANTVFEVDAVRRLVKGLYEWKVAALDKKGNEFPCEMRRFQYDAPSATFGIRTYDDGGTAETGDDMLLPRVSVNYDALSGVDMGLSLSTDKQGERLGLLFSPGTYVFSANREGFAPLCDTLSFSAGGTFQWNARLRPDRCVLTGKAVNGSGEPLEAVQITARHSLFPQAARQTASDRDGRFTVTLTPGPWRVSALKAGYQTSGEASVTASSGEIQQLASPLMLRENANKIKGAVVNSIGQAVYGADVKIQNGGLVQQTATNADGLFAFSASDGSWLLSVSKSGFVSPSARWISVSGGTVVTITPCPQLLSSGSLISGAVSDGQAAVAGAVVRAEPPSGSPLFAVSDAYGQFTIIVSPGTTILSAGKDGFAAAGRTAVMVGSNETVTGVSLRVAAAPGTLSGLVTLDGFTPLAGVTVSIFDDKTTLTDAAGRYAFRIPQGYCRVAASKNGYLGGSPVDVQAAAHQSIENVDFQLAPNASTLRGQVVSSNGGVAGAVVRTVSGETRTNDSGTYVLNVHAGTHTVSASKTGFQTKSIQVVAGQAQVLEGNTISLTYYPAAIQGRVGENSPAAGLLGVRVDAVEAGLSTFTKPNGSYRLELDPSVKGYSLRFSKEGYETRTLATGPVSAGQTAVFDVALKNFPTLLWGRVADLNGAAVGGAEVSAKGGFGTAGATTESDGVYRLYLPPEGGACAVSISKNGYGFPSGSENVVLSPGEKRNRDFTLQSRFARLKVNVASTTEPFVSRAWVKLKTGEGLVASVSTDEAGTAVFVDVPEGVYDLSSGKSGYGETTAAGFSPAAGLVKTISMILTRCTGFLEGKVSDGTNPIPDATIEARLENTEQSFTRATDSAGRFKLDRIPAGRYLVKVSCSGHTFNKDTTVVAPSSGLSFILIKNRGRFRGSVVDRETGQGIAYAGLAARDGRGNEARVSASQDGSYDMTLLPALFPYTVQAYAGGYGTVARENLSAEKNDTTLFRLQRVTGSVQGQVTLKTEGGPSDGATPSDGVMPSDGAMPAAGVPVRVSSGSIQFRDTTNSDGLYRVERLPVNQYDVTVEKAGYLSSPAFRSVGLWSGGDKTGIDFQLEKVDLAGITISGPATLESGKTGLYSYSAKTTDGRPMSISPRWSIDLPAAVDSLGPEGALVVKADFIGPLRLLLKDAYTGMEDSIWVHVTAMVRPGDGGRRFRDYRGAEFTLPAGCVGQNIMLGLKCPDTPEAKRLSVEYRAEGRVYALQPDGLLLLKPMTVVLPLPVDGASLAVPGKWNAQRLTWEVAQGTAVRNGIQVESDGLAQWTVLEPSEPLGIRQFTAEPNPFSPWVEPLKLSFIPTSNASTTVFVTVKAFGVNGETVRKLAVDSPFPKGRRLEIAWDGKTDSGGDALNGRYFVLIEAKDGSGTIKKLISVVLVK